MPSQKKIMIYTGVMFACLVFLSSIDIRINPISDPNERIDDINEYNIIDIPTPSDSFTFYQSNWGYTVEELFSSGTDISDWSEDHPSPILYGGGTVVINSGNLVLAGDGSSGGEQVRAEYVDDPHPYPFTDGYLWFTYDIDEGTQFDFFRLDIYDGSWSNNVWEDTTEGNWETQNISLSSYNTEHSDFTFRFDFRGTDTDDLVSIDTVYISTYEFSWQETDGEAIDEGINQDISVMVAPAFTSETFATSNVTVLYSVNDLDLDNSDTDSSYSGSGNFTLTIPESAYGSSDIVYYQIWIHDSGPNEYHKTPIYNFQCYDETAPSISNINDDASDYLTDINVDCNVVDNTNGVGMRNVTMYIRNSTAASKSDTLILCQENGAIPDGGGTFNFIIPSVYLSARTNLHYRIYFEDDNDNEDWTGDLEFSLTDGVDPVVSFDDDNSTGNQIEADMNLLVNYSITEPSAGIGLKEVELFVRVETTPPGGNLERNFDIAPLEDVATIGLSGGIFTFIIPESIYEYGKTIYCWVNATDLSDNQHLDYTLNRAYTVIDTIAPSVVFDPSNAIAASYNDTNKFLLFNITEPGGGPGINNATLSYQLEDPLLSSPTVIEYLNIDQYTNTSIFDIDGLSWKYGQRVYYRLIVYDKAHNMFDSTILNFLVSDYIKPNFVENANNTNGWVYGYDKLMNFTVSDPDYDDLNISSGIKYIHLYWKAGSAFNIGEHDDVIVTTMQSIVKNQSTYTFNLTTTLTMFNMGPEIFYRINVTDEAGSYNISDVKSFMLYSSAIVPGSLQLPAQYIGSPTFIISFNLNFFSEIWYCINDTEYYEERIPFSNTFFKVFMLNENPIGVPHNITFFFMENQTSYTYSFYIDLTAPSKVSGIEYNLFGDRVLEILWDTPTGTDIETIYRIYRSTDSGNIVTAENLLIELHAGNLLVKLDVGNKSYSDETIEAGTTYYYIIVAVDRVGNISEISEVLTVSIPGNPIMMILLIIIIGAVAGLSVFVIRKSAVKKRREMLFSKVDLKALDVEDDFELDPKKGASWSTIQTKAPEASVIAEGIEFAAEVAPIAKGGYWPHEIGKMISEAANYEIKDEHAKALNLYTILLRFSRRANIPLLTMTLEAKLKSYYKTI